MKKISYKNISEELIMRITEEYIAYKNNNKVTKDKRNIVNKIGRPNKISIRKAVIYAYKIINGSKLEDLVEDIKEISSYQKYIRSIKTSGILTNIFKDTINNLNNEKKIDLTCIHIDSTNILNLNGHEDVSFGYRCEAP
jgi:predicted nuclease of restriction endonuclease-like RecB superfamily